MPDESQMIFSNQWFDLTAKSSWDRLFETGFAPQKILEVGSYEGRSLCYLIDKLGPLPTPLEIHVVDTWHGGHDHGGVDMDKVEERFKNNLEAVLRDTKMTRSPTIQIHKAPSDLVLAALLSAGHQSSFEFIYVDGSHMAYDVLTDAVLAFRLLKPGGVLVFDDYTWRQGMNPLFCPKTAIDSFVNIHFDRLEVLSAAISQFHLRKLR